MWYKQENKCCYTKHKLTVSPKMYQLPIEKFSVKIIAFRLNMVSSLKSKIYENHVLRQIKIFKIKIFKDVFDSVFEQNYLNTGTEL